jgi:hypothetical protein
MLHWLIGSIDAKYLQSKKRIYMYIINLVRNMVKILVLVSKFSKT